MAYTFLKQHWQLLLLTLLVAFIYGSHHIFVPYFLEEGPASPGQGGFREYYPVTHSSNGDEAVFYGPRANTVFNGAWLAGDVVLREHEGGPSFLPILNPIVMGLLGKLTGSIHRAFILSDFIFPPLIFILLYLLALEIFNRRFFSLLFATLFIFSPKIFLLNPREVISGAIPFFGKYELLYFERFEYPKITFLFFVLAFYFALRALKRGGKLNTILSGVSFGLLFYTYFHDWAYFVVSLFLAFLIFLVEKEYAKAKTVIFIGFTGLAVSSFYWLNFWNLTSLPQYKDILSRIGVEVGNQIRLATVWKSYARNLVFILLLFFAIGRKERALFAYLASWLLGYFIVVNAQIITGFNPHPDHWYRIHFLPTALSVFVLALWVYEKHSQQIPKKYFLAAGYVFISLFLITQLYGQYVFSKTNAQNFTLPRDIRESYEWLKQNTPQGSVVGSISSETNTEIPLYTNNKIFVPSGGNTLASNDEIWDRFMFMARVFKFSSDEFRQLAIQYDSYLFQEYHRDHYFDSDFLGKAKQNIPEHIIAEKILKYSAYPKSILQNNTYKLDYIFVGPSEKAIIGAHSKDLPSSLKRLYNNGQVDIYEAPL